MTTHNELNTPAMPELLREIVAYCREAGHDWSSLNEAEHMLAALSPQADHPDTARCIKARNDLNAALHGEGALIDDLEHAVANACAKLLRPQAVPKTEGFRILYD